MHPRGKNASHLSYVWWGSSIVLKSGQALFHINGDLYQSALSDPRVPKPAQFHREVMGDFGTLDTQEFQS